MPNSVGFQDDCGNQTNYIHNGQVLYNTNVCTSAKRREFGLTAALRRVDSLELSHYNICLGDFVKIDQKLKYIRIIQIRLHICLQRSGSVSLIVDSYLQNSGALICKIFSQRWYVQVSTFGNFKIMTQQFMDYDFDLYLVKLFTPRSIYFLT